MSYYNFSSEKERGHATVGQMTTEIGLFQSTISDHLNELKKYPP
ncbi:ArsR family transcriptional regulator [Pollutibacter soli]